MKRVAGILISGDRVELEETGPITITRVVRRPESVTLHFYNAFGRPDEITVEPDRDITIIRQGD